MGKGMVKEHLLGGVNRKETNMKENGKMVNIMVKEQVLHLMERCMKGNSRMGKNMVKEYLFHLMEVRWKWNTGMGLVSDY